MRSFACAAVVANTEHGAAAQANERIERLHAGEVALAADTARRAAASADALILEEGSKELEDQSRDQNDEAFVPKEQLFRAARLSPGDVVTTSYAETGRDIRVTAEQIRRGAAIRNDVERKVRARAEAKRDAKFLGAIAERDKLEAKAREVRSAEPAKVVPLSPLLPVFREAKAITDKHGARLVIVVLPIDVQVSKDEWNKYGVDPPIDMEPSKILNADVIVAAETVGAQSFDALPALGAAEPGAFLVGDIHMTAKGHHALGEALAKALREPPLARPRDGLPPDRSWAPSAEEWTPTTEIAVAESDPAGCETKKVREWLGVFCRHKGGAKGVKVDKGFDVIAGAVPGEAVLVAPMVSGQDVRAVFAFEGGTRELTVTVKDSPETAAIAFSKLQPARADIPGPSAEAAALCACVVARKTASGNVKGGATCALATAAPDPDCAKTYPNDCDKLLACAEGNRLASPSCPAVQAIAGASRRCHPLCSKEVPCKSGTCTAWQGGQLCL